MYMLSGVIGSRQNGKYYEYELSRTIFYVDGGGQLNDKGTMNGLDVLLCFEEDGHIYHRVSEPLESVDVILHVDKKHRYISMQGHSAQHLISAGFRTLCQMNTISHHYNLEGSSIDITGDTLTNEMIEEVETWVNQKIGEHINIDILYPTKEQLAQMELAHPLTVTENVRIVQMKGIENNPCKGLHVLNTSEIGMIVITGFEKIKTGYRVYYMFGEVAKNYFHAYHQVLKDLSVKLSKPMLSIKEGVDLLQKQIADLNDQLFIYKDAYVKSLANQLVNKAVDGKIVEIVEVDKDLKNKLLNQLIEMDHLYGYLLEEGKISIFASKDSGVNARDLLNEAKQKLDIKGGGNNHIVQGKMTSDQNLEDIVNLLK